MKVQVDRQRCVGSGQCAQTAPDIFDQDERDGIVILLAAEAPEVGHAAARKAANLCPARAISIIEEE
jgi:ferredoxin